MITYQEAIERIRQHVEPLPAEEVGIDRLLNRVLAEPVSTRCDLPAFDNSSVDGYGLTLPDLYRLRDGECLRLQCVMTVGTGSWPSELVHPEECAKIMTGAPIPDGVAAVVMYEDVEIEGESIVVRNPVQPNAHIRRRGEELRKGQVVLPAGAVCSPLAITAIAASGNPSATVRRLPKVGLLIAGNESSPGNELQFGQVFESTSYGVIAALNALGIDVVVVRRIRDERRATQSALAELLDQCDVVLSTGGASDDPFTESLMSVDVEPVFTTLAIEPGKMATFGRRGATLVFALPGNAMSVMVTLSVLVLPALRGLAGLPVEPPPSRRLRLASRVDSEPGQLGFVPSRIANDSVVPISEEGFHMMGGLANADALIVVPAEAERVEEGTTVLVMPLDLSW